MFEINFGLKVTCIRGNVQRNLDEGPVPMDDNVKFDQVDIFCKFTLLLSGGLRPQQVPIKEVCACYFYAEKYHVEGLKNSLLHRILSNSAEFKLDEMKECLVLTDIYDLSEVKSKLDNVDIEVALENSLPWYEILVKYKMDKLLAQLVCSLVGAELDKSWPFDLIKLIVYKERLLCIALKLENKSLKGEVIDQRIRAWMETQTTSELSSLETPFLMHNFN